MWRVPLLALCLLLCAGAAFSQSTVVSGVITDLGGQVWSNGTYTLTFKPSPSNPSGQYFWNGAPFSSSQSISGQLNGSGAFSVSVPSNTSITPSGSTWAITVASAATSPGYTTSLTITGASQSISASVIPPAIAINLAVSPGSFTTAYTDAEIVAAVVGSSYYNLTGQIQHYCQVVSGPACITWSTGGGSGSGNASISGSNCEPAYLSTTMDLLHTGSHYFYGECYTSGADPMANYLLCHAAAIAVNGTCDARGLLAGTTFSAEGFVCGDAAGDPVTVLLPPFMRATITLPGTTPLTTPLVKIYQAGCNIPFAGPSGGSQFINGSADQVPYALIDIVPTTAQTGFFSIAGFSVTNHQATSVNNGLVTNATVTGGNAGCLIQAGNDNSIIDTVGCFDSANAESTPSGKADNTLWSIIPTAGGPCCSFLMINDWANAASVGGIPLYAQGVAGGATFNVAGISVAGGSWGHPGVGNPNISLYDHSADNQLVFNFSGAQYMELNQTATNNSVPIINIDGVNTVDMGAATCQAEAFESGTTQSFVLISNYRTTNFKSCSNIGKVFAGSWTFPTIAVQNNNTGFVGKTNSNGWFTGYDTDSDYRENLVVNTHLWFLTSSSGTYSQIQAALGGSNQNILYLDPILPGGSANNSQVNLFRFTNTTGTGCLNIFDANNTSTTNSSLCSGGPSYIALSGALGVGNNGFNCNSLTKIFCLGSSGTQPQAEWDASGNETLYGGAGITFVPTVSGGNSTIQVNSTGSLLLGSSAAQVTPAGALTVTSCTGCGVTSGVSEATWGAGQITNMAANGVWGETVLPSNHTLVRLTVFVTTAAVACTTYPQFTITDVTTSTPLASIALTSGVSFTDSGALSVAMTGGDTIEIAVTRAYNTCGTNPLDASVTAVYK